MREPRHVDPGVIQCPRDGRRVAGRAGSRTPIATLSIAGAAPDTGEVGVAVASKFFAGGCVVPRVRSSAGAILCDVAIIQSANGAREEATAALRRAIAANPRLRDPARGDSDLDRLRQHDEFAQLVGPR